MLGKPHTPEVARERIRAMRRTSATLWTGHSAAILAPASSTDGRTGTRTVSASVTRSASTQVHFGDISDAEIDAYVAIRVSRCTWQDPLQWTAWAVPSSRA